jgi:glutamate--cysteine ligase
MNFVEPRPVTRKLLLDYFLQAAKPRERWRVGMEIERLGRRVADGKPIPYDDGEASVRRVLETYRAERGGQPICEGSVMIGIDSSEWVVRCLRISSSRPHPTLDGLHDEMRKHLTTLDEAGAKLGVRWLEEAVDPIFPVSEMPWMPKARYGIMGPFLGARGRLAHRMMTQSASIQTAFDYADPEDWRRKFLAGSLMAPVATALFANSSRIDGAESGYRSYRQAIWDETDPDRCRLPAVVFAPDFSLEKWLAWILEVPTIFRHRARGLVPAGGPPFNELVSLTGCDAIRQEDWETHVSTIFTEVRSYTYIEVRSAALQPPNRMFSVPAFWTGILYNDDALSAALELGAPFHDHEVWSEAMQSAAKDGLAARIGSHTLGDLATESLAIASRGLQEGAACVPTPETILPHLETLK